MKRIGLSSLVVTSLALGGVINTTGCVAPPDRSGKEAGTAEASGDFVTHEDVDDSMNKLVEGDRYRVTYDPKADIWAGGAEKSPLVTIVEYSDIQCPFCSKLTNSLKEVEEEFPEDVRVVFKHFPLPMHKDAHLASQSVLAAQAQGKGWEMHLELFDNQKKLKKEDLLEHAKSVGVADMAAFEKALDDGTYKDQVDADMAAGKNFAVRSTPSFFVNGIPMRGAVGADKIKALVEKEKELAEKLIAEGSKREEVYARIMKAAKESRKPEPRKQQKRPGAPDPEKNYAVPADDRPMWGNEEALVTIVEFSDFQCPFCSRVNPTISKIKEEYPDDVRIVFRQLPLPMHKQAPAAAKASLAAGNQGKFWEMHDALFQNSKALNDDKFKELAEEIGLDMGKFEKDYKSDEVNKMLEEDMKIASQFGARGTPAFFVNGRFVSGAQPFEAFDALIKDEKKKAEKFMKDKKVDPKDLYAEMAKGWETEVKAPPPKPTADFKRREVSTDGLPHKGAKGKAAKITIVECSDFDCPFCKRGAGYIDEVMKEYGDKTAFYFRNYPLPMHKQAEPAHRAAIAAGNQGKFWEMHDLLFADKTKRSEQDFTAMATQLELDVDKFKADWADPSTAQKVKDDMAACSKLGVRGAPGFLINGRLMSGAQPVPRIKAVLEEELNGGFEATQKKAEKEKGKKDKGDKKEKKEDK